MRFAIIATPGHPHYPPGECIRHGDCPEAVFYHQASEDFELVTWVASNIGNPQLYLWDFDQETWVEKPEGAGLLAITID